MLLYLHSTSCRANTSTRAAIRLPTLTGMRVKKVVLDHCCVQDQSQLCFVLPARIQYIEQKRA